MKSLIIFLALTFFVMFSSSSYAGWTKVGKNTAGTTYYLDFERIRKYNGYVYYWMLSDYLKASLTGTLSSKVYSQCDCKLFRFKGLSYSYHKEPMGGGTGNTDSVPDKEWKYPRPNSVDEEVLQTVCNR
jgi:hypothetical protein